MAVPYGTRDGLLTVALVLAIGMPQLVLSHLFARGRAHAGSLSGQVLAGVGLGLALSLIGIALIARLLFSSRHDVLLMALLLSIAAGLTVHVALLLVAGVRRDIAAVHEGVRAVSAGSRRPAISTAAEDELSALADAANDMAARLAERERERDAAEAARRRLIAGISHDLRTPLTSLQLIGKAIEDGMLEGGRGDRTYLAQIPGLVRVLDDLIEDLFELSRLEAGDVQWSLQAVSLRAVTRGAAESLRPQAETTGVAVENRVSAGLPLALGNPDRLQRVLCNLIQNAIHNTPPDGSVTVAATVVGEQIEVEVSDSGPGVAPAERELIFDAFHRGGPEASRTSRGAGLGLTISRAIVEAHGGRLWLEDGGAGARFRFTLRAAAQTSG